MPGDSEGSEGRHAYSLGYLQSTISRPSRMGLGRYRALRTLLPTIATCRSLHSPVSLVQTTNLRLSTSGNVTLEHRHFRDPFSGSSETPHTKLVQPLLAGCAAFKPGQPSAPDNTLRDTAIDGRELEKPLKSQVFANLGVPPDTNNSYTPKWT
jgi:hypothetical protein